MSAWSLRQVGLDKYYSPDVIAEKIKELCLYTNTTYIDPCAGTNALFNVLPQPKLRFDIEDGVDFLETTRDTFGSTPITFVMNPPFSIHKDKRRNGVIAFLNHANKCLHTNEHIICVVPQTMRKWSNIAKVDSSLHLVEEHVFTKKCEFSVGAHKSKVFVAIQIWQKRNTVRLEPVLLKSSRMFVASFYKPADFYMRVWGTLEKIGQVAKDTPKKIPNKRRYSTIVGTLPIDVGCGTAVGIKAKTLCADVLYEKFNQMFLQKEWIRFMRFKCAGNNNPTISVKILYTLFEKGLVYLQKETYGITVHLIP